MRLHWSARAHTDLMRLHAFLAEHDRAAAAQLVNALVAAPETLMLQPRQGQRLKSYSSREVRRLLVGRYEFHYEVAGDNIYLLGLWHTREQRP